MGGLPVSVALVAGALAVVNPCAFPLLPAFLSFYLGVDEERLPPAASRVAQSLLVGALVTAGFLGLFALAALPVVLGVGAIERALPWVGLVTGGLLAALGLLVLGGLHLALPVRLPVRARRERRAGAIVMFGVAYGAASLGCTFPVFLVLVGVSLGGAKLAVLGAYGAGMAVVLMTLSVAVALLRAGLARSVRRLLPYMERIAGALLAVAGGYLAYYWGRILFGDVSTLADDPVVGFVTRYAARIEDGAGSRAWVLLAIAAAALAAAAAWALRRHGPVRRPRARVVAAVLAALALAAAGAVAGLRGGSTPGTARAAAGAAWPPPGRLTTLDSLDRFRALFNQAAGEPRLVLIVSPT